MNSYIICSADINLAYEKALSMAAELVGNSEKAARNVHPDIITVRKDEAKTELSVDKVRWVVSDAAILPNESPYKVYIFYDAQYMNMSAQNAALKLLEEPPSHVVIMLLANSASAFLPTIRSRCAEININADTEFTDRSSEFASSLMEVLSKNDKIALFRFCEASNGMSIPECRAAMLAVQELAADMLTGRKPSLGIGADRLLEINGLTEKCIKYLGSNVSVKQIFGIIEVS